MLGDRVERFELRLEHWRSGDLALAETLAALPVGMALKRAERLRRPDVGGALPTTYAPGRPGENLSTA